MSCKVKIIEKKDPVKQTLVNQELKTCLLIF